MNDISDGIGGTAVDGSQSRAAALEPNAGDGHFHETTCLNCGTQLVGSHCHECGQEAHLHRTVGAFLHGAAGVRANPGGPVTATAVAAALPGVVADFLAGRLSGERDW